MKRPLRAAFLILFAFLLLAGIPAGFWLLRGLPDPSTLTERTLQPSVQITDRDGRLLYEMLPEEGGRHTVVPLDQIPLALKQATVATEDSHFYQNSGIDPGGILRSVWINLRGGETLAGGSTITQQVARNLLLEPAELSGRSLRRKLRETILAWQITRRYSKDEILGFYLNQMYYGGMAYGVEAAAQTYFAKSARELDLAECALLAGLPQSPARYNPFTDLQAAKKRQAVVLERMAAEGYITPEEQDLAWREPLVLSSEPYPMQAPHFVTLVRAQLDEMITPQEVRAAGGLVVTTSLNLDWQHEAERAVTAQLERLHNSLSEPLGYNVNNAALVALDVHSGEILAMVGSPDFNDAAHAGAVNMVLSPRQPGSALKPLIYAAAFDPTRPDPMTAASMILDVRTSFQTHNGRPYTPVNYDGLEHGPVLARQALASSLNIPAVITLNRLGLPDFFNFANRLGITTLGDPRQADLSIALGGGEVRLLDLTAAYGAFASGGFRISPFSILEIRGQDGRVLYTARPAEKKRVLDERVAWLVSDILSDDDARVLGFGRNSILRLDRPAAVKTGTTTNFHDNWTVGYTPDVVVGVWAGNTSHEAMRNVTGLSGAAPIWHQFLRAVLAGTPEKHFNRPAGLVQAEICTLSGKLRTQICPDPRAEWFIPGTQPREYDDFYRAVVLDTATGQQADDSTPGERRITDLVLNLPPAAENWARANGLRLLEDTLPADSASHQAFSADGAPVALVVINPPPGSIYQIARGIPLESQQLRLEVQGLSGTRDVRIIIDGQVAARIPVSPFEAWWTMTPGEHQIWAEAVGQNGQYIASQKIIFSVKP